MPRSFRVPLLVRMDYRFLIARRYLVSRRRLTLISVISGISVAGVAVGVAALVVVLSVMNGFFDVVRDLLVSYDPHVRIEATEGRGLADVDSLASLVMQENGVVSATPYVEGKALLSTEGGGTLNQVVVVRGLDPRAVDDEVQKSIRDGAFDLARRDGSPSIVIGNALALRTGVYPSSTEDDLVGIGGSKVALLSASSLERALTMIPFGLPDQRSFDVRGTFELEPTYDETHVFVSLEEAQRLFRMSGTVSGLDIRLANLDDAGTMRDELQARLTETFGAGRFNVSTWYDLQGSLYGVMKLEKWAASAILLLIIIVAAVNIVGALTMIVIEKRRDLGALQAMGASRRDVRRIFLIEGLLVGGLGTGIGLAVGLTIALVQKVFGVVKLAEAGSFVIDAYPVSIRAFDITGIVVVAVGLCALAALYPAARASNVDPARAVQEGS